MIVKLLRWLGRENPVAPEPIHASAIDFSSMRFAGAEGNVAGCLTIVPGHAEPHSREPLYLPADRSSDLKKATDLLRSIAAQIIQGHEREVYFATMMVIETLPEIQRTLREIEP